MRAAAVITDSEHEPLPPYFDTTRNGPRTAERHASKNVATRVDSVWVDSSTSSSFCQKMPKSSGLTTFFLHFVGFVFFGVTGVAVGIPAMFTSTRERFSRSFSVVLWGRAGIQFTPSISRVTVDSASTGISASGERSWFPFERRVSFRNARTQLRNLESFR